MTATNDSDTRPVWPPTAEPLPLRKLRLAACGCCRAAWPRLAPAARRAVRAAERYADGSAACVELEAARRACRRVERKAGVPAGGFLQTEEVHRVAAPVVTPADVRAVAADLRPWRGDSTENDEVDAACAGVIRDVVGGPARPPAGVAGWRTPGVVALARAAYRGRGFALLPPLADVLEAAGCRDPDVLDHCRGGGPHVRGCWLLDLLR